MAEQQESDATYSMALPAGLELGDYRILRALGQGGFGITYLAERLQDGEQVVIKENLPGDIAFRHPDSLQVIPTRTQGPQGEYARSLAAFVEEARLLARLEHPNVVKVYEAFEALNTAYYVMHWVGGTELHKAAPAPDKIDEAWLQPILRALLDALGYLHGEGVYHRDVKPANILLTPEGKPVLIDFGTARNIVSERSATHVGTPGYCPIEQVSSGGNRGPWTDVYALGATCYRLITGERPPSAEDRLVEEDDMLHPLSFRAELRGRFSAAFLQSIDKAMALRAKNRWQGTQDWLVALPKPGGNTPRRPSVNTSRIDVSSPLSQITQPQEDISAASGKSSSTPVKKGKGWVVLLLLLLLGLSGAGWYGFREYERGIAAQIQAAEEAARRAEDIARQAAAEAEAARREEEQRQAAAEAARREEEQRQAAAEAARKAAAAEQEAWVNGCKEALKKGKIFSGEWSRDRSFGAVSIRLDDAACYEDAIQFIGALYDTKLPEASMDISGRCALERCEDGTARIDIKIYDGLFDPDEPTAEIYDENDSVRELYLTTEGKLRGTMTREAWKDRPEKAFQMNLAPAPPAKGKK